MPPASLAGLDLSFQTPALLGTPLRCSRQRSVHLTSRQLCTAQHSPQSAPRPGPAELLHRRSPPPRPPSGVPDSKPRPFSHCIPLRRCHLLPCVRASYSEIIIDLRKNCKDNPKNTTYLPQIPPISASLPHAHFLLNCSRVRCRHVVPLSLDSLAGTSRGHPLTDPQHDDQSQTQLCFRGTQRRRGETS